MLNTFTFGEDFRDFCVTCTESAVNFEAVCIVEERATKREQHFLWSKRKILYYNTGYENRSSLISSPLKKKMMA